MYVVYLCGNAKNYSLLQSPLWRTHTKNACVYLSSTSQHHSDWLEQYIFVTQPVNATLIGRNDVSGGAIECIITVKR